MTNPRRNQLLVPLAAIGAIVLLIVIGVATLSRHGKNADAVGHTPTTTLRPVGGQPVTSGRTEPSRPGAPVQAPGPHTPVHSGGLEFTVTGVESNVHNIGRATAKGNYTIITLNVTNTDDIVGNFFTGQQQLIDSTGRVLDQDAHGGVAYRTAHPDPLRLFGAIDPGQTITAHLVFDLPAGASPGYLQVRDGPAHPAVMVALS